MAKLIQSFMNNQKFTAGGSFPTIMIKTVNNGEVDLGKPQNGKDWKMVVVYRGKHCPMCTNYLKQLEHLKDRFSDLGVDIIAVSADPQSKSSVHIQEMKLTFPVAYDLSIEQMETLGLYISHPRSAQETDRPFAEPGLYIINEKNQVHITSVSNAPFARPELRVLLGSLGFVRNSNYPVRGTMSNTVENSALYK